MPPNPAISKRRNSSWPGWPPRRGRTVRIELPQIRTAGGVSEAMVAVLDAMAAGDITADETATIAGILEIRRKAIETQEFAERINRLEQQTGSRGARLWKAGCTVGASSWPGRLAAVRKRSARYAGLSVRPHESITKSKAVAAENSFEFVIPC